MSPTPAPKIFLDETKSDTEARKKRPAAVPDSVRVIDRAQAIEAIGVSWNTWERMEERGETPPVTKLSKRRIGYRVVDLQKWLDARRQSRGAPA
jgi:predicted DNA-binding transcriptional regulator AlpA